MPIWKLERGDQESDVTRKITYCTAGIVHTARTKNNVVRAKPSLNRLPFAVGDFKKIALLIMLPCPKTMWRLQESSIVEPIPFGPALHSYLTNTRPTSFVKVVAKGKKDVSSSSFYFDHSWNVMPLSLELRDGSNNEAGVHTKFVVEWGRCLQKTL